MLIIRNLIISSLFCTFLTTGFGQDMLKKANKQFELKSFELAIENYTQYLETNPDDLQARLNLALSHAHAHNYLNSIRQFEQVITAQNGSLDEEHILNYAGLLKKIGLYDKAQVWYWKYKFKDPRTSEHYALSCDFAKSQLQEEDRFEISLSPISTKNSEFGVGFYENRLVTAAFDPNISDKNLLFIENESTGSLERYGDVLNEKKGIAPVSFSRDGRLVAYNNNNFTNGANQVFADDTEMGIYFSFMDETNQYNKEIPFPYNDADYSNAFPNLSFNGSALYFSSNKPGGFGGFDVYVSYFKKGEWSEPKNLGPSVNSTGNEITPFFDGQSLYYSSDYTHGLGGFDIFKSRVVNGEWSYGENMGKGVNSPGDDYYLVINQNSGEIYFTSNRIGGRGKDDIYMAREVVIDDLAAAKMSEQIESIYIPKAVSLSDLNPANESNSIDNTVAVSFENKSKDTKLVTVSDHETVIKTIDVKSTVDLNGARKVSVGEVSSPVSSVYFVQLASLSRSQADVSKFRGLMRYGSIYKIYRTNATKVVLGYYLDKQEAYGVLQNVRKSGYRDAFITTGSLNDGSVEVVASNYEANDYATDSFAYKTQSKYKVRLAAYEDALWFESNTVSDLGKIEQWTKGDWTIFVLSGFGNFEDAQSAMRSAVNRGYQDAEVVIDNNGILERMVTN